MLDCNYGCREASGIVHPRATEPRPTGRFNLKVSLLGPSRAAVLRRAVDDGLLDGLILDGQLWVNRADVHDLLPPGHDTYDPADECCFVPDRLLTPEGLV